MLLEAEMRERKSAEAARRLADDRYRSLFNSLESGFCIIELAFDAAGVAKDYRFLEINPAFARQTGLNRSRGQMDARACARSRTAPGSASSAARSPRLENPFALRTRPGR